MGISSGGKEFFLEERILFFNPIALRKAKIVYKILAFLSAIGLRVAPSLEEPGFPGSK